MFCLLVSLALAQDAPSVDWSPLLDVRQRLTLDDSAIDPDAGGFDRAIGARVRLGMEVQRLGVSARVSFQETRSWAVESGSVSPAGFAPTVAEGWARVEGDLTRNVGAVATLGRQPITLHEGRIVGTDDYSLDGQFLDAARIVVHVTPFEFEYVNARRFTGALEDPLGLGVNVVRVGAHLANPVTSWVVDGLWVVDARQTADTTSTLGTWLRLDSGRWRSRAEGYVQTSTTGTATLVGLSTGWVFGPNERLVATLRYDGLSGEDAVPVGGRTAWRPVLGDTHHFNGLMDRFAEPAATDGGGLSDLQVSVDTRPAPPLYAGLTAHRFWSPIAGDTYGYELDGGVAWDFSPFARAAARGAWFLPESPAVGSHGLFGYLEIDVAF